MDSDRAHSKTCIGTAHHVHRDGVGAEQFASEAGAPGFVLPPVEVVGPAGAVSAGAGGVDRGAARQIFQLGGPRVAAVRDRAGEGCQAMPSATSRRTVRRSRSTVQVDSVVRFRTRTTSPQGWAGRSRRTIGSHASNWARMLSR